MSDDPFDYVSPPGKVRSALARVVIPEGWKLVPIEPTPEMMAALWSTMFQEAFTDQHVLVGAGYDAMLAAAPAPPNK